MSKLKNLSGIALIGAPLLMLIADTNFLLFKGQYFWFGTIALFLSFYAYIGAIYGLCQLSNWTNIALVGAMVAVFGALAGETIMGLERVGWAMNEVGLKDEIKNTVGHPMVFFTSRVIGLAFPIGLILLGISLFNAKKLNIPALILLTIGIILFPIGRIVFGPVANVPGDLIMLLIYGKLGIELLRQE